MKVRGTDDGRKFDKDGNEIFPDVEVAEGVPVPEGGTGTEEPTDGEAGEEAAPETETEPPSQPA